MKNKKGHTKYTKEMCDEARALLGKKIPPREQARLLTEKFGFKVSIGSLSWIRRADLAMSSGAGYKLRIKHD